jgi:replicative DNA helicase
MPAHLREPEVPPPPLYNTEAEQAVLGAVLCDNILVGRVAGLLTPVRSRR